METKWILKKDLKRSIKRNLKGKGTLKKELKRNLKGRSCCCGPDVDSRTEHDSHIEPRRSKIEHASEGEQRRASVVAPRDSARSVPQRSRTNDVPQKEKVTNKGANVPRDTPQPLNDPPQFWPHHGIRMRK